MPMSISTFYSPPIFLKCPQCPPKIAAISPPLPYITTNRTLRLQTPTSSRLQFRRIEGLTSRFSFSGKKLTFSARAETGQEGGPSNSASDEEQKEHELRGQSTMPDRFRYLTKEAPAPPLRWPWLIALGFLLYTWRTVLWELSNWRKALVGIANFVGYILKLILAVIFHFIGDPISYTILCVETALHAMRSFYSSIIQSAPVPELTVIIMLASAVLSIAEAASPDCVSSQPYLLVASSIIGYAAVRGFISEPFFWTLLLGIYGFARLVKKRDYVASALPSAGALASVGEPWVRALTIISFAGLAIHYYSKNSAGKKEEGKNIASGVGKPPLSLLGVALAIGIHVAARWAGYRHLTWKLV